LNRGFAPEGELLSFASPRQLFLRSSLSPGVAEGPSLTLWATRCILAAPLRAIPGESFGTPRGIRDWVPASGRFFCFFSFPRVAWECS